MLLRPFAIFLCGWLACACASSSDTASWREALYGDLPPEEAEAYGDYLAGRFAALTNAPDEAAQRYVEALNRQPDSARHLEKAVYALLLAGETEQAMSISRRSRDMEVGVAPVSRLVAAIEAYRDGDYALVPTLLEGEDLGAFNESIAHFLIGWSLAAGGDVDGAVRLFGTPADPALDRLKLFSQAYVLVHAGRQDEALVYLDAAAKAGMRLPATSALHAQLLIAEGRAQDAEALFELIDTQALSEARLMQVEQAYRNKEELPLMQIDANKGAALSISPIVAILAGRSSQQIAIAYFNLVLALDPAQEDTIILLSTALAQNGRNAEAYKVLQQVPKTSAFYPIAQSQSAWVLFQLDEQEKARHLAEETLALSPSRAVRVQMGDLFRAMETYDRAADVLSAIAAQDAQDNAPDWRVLFALGAAQERLGRWEEAEDNLVAALKIEPNRPEVLNYLGYSWIDRGKNIEQAFRLIRQAISQRPDAGYIVDSLGWAYYRLGRYDEAVRYLERAAELDPDDPVINDHLGDAYWRVGRFEQARYQWERVKYFDPDEEILRSVDQKITDGLSIAPLPPQDVFVPGDANEDL